MLSSNSRNTETDEQLLHFYRNTKDVQWLGVLLQRYTLLLLGVCMKYLKDRTDAQDAVQQVFVKALTHFPEGEIKNFKGWLYVLARNHCLQQLRDQKRFQGDEVLEHVAQEEEVMSAREHEFTLSQMEEGLNELNKDQKLCVTEFYLNRKSYTEIMETTGFSFAQVKSHIQNGKRNLRIILLQRLSQKAR